MLDLERPTWAEIVTAFRSACESFAVGSGVEVPPALAGVLEQAERKAREEPGALVVLREACVKGFLLAYRAKATAAELAEESAVMGLASSAADLLGYRVVPNEALDAVFRAGEETFSADVDRDIYSPDWPEAFLRKLAGLGFKIVPDWQS